MSTSKPEVMKVLVIKLTSMGDAIHVLPALSDLQAHYPSVEVDWMIEESFAEIPNWHPSVSKVICVATRRWRAFNISSLKEFIAFWKDLRKTPYDVVIDAQGLMKSAVFARFAKVAKNGRRLGFSGDSIKESPAAYLYKEKIQVSRNIHAIARLKGLFAKGFDYQLSRSQLDEHSNDDLDYQITPRTKPSLLVEPASPKQTIMFLHGTTWASKHLPEQHWLDLLSLANADGYDVLLPWGNQTEKDRATRLAAQNPNAHVMPKSTLSELRQTMTSVSAAIAVDTGLGHLAAALGIPTVSIYGSTNAELTGALGDKQVHVQTRFDCSPCMLKHCDKLTSANAAPPCYQQATPAHIWSLLMQQVN